MASENYRAPSVTQSAELAEQQGQVIVHALADAYTAGAEGLQFGGLARMEALAAALAATGKQQVDEVQGDARARFEAWNNSLPSLYRYNLNRWSNEAQEYRSRHTRAAFTAWQAALAARQPGAQEPVAVVGPDFTLLWAGSGPIALIVERHGLKRGSLLYAAPPAQGIDLGQFREAVEAQHAALMSSWCGDPETKDAADQQRDRLLALIDQRDAAPGVGNG